MQKFVQYFLLCKTAFMLIDSKEYLTPWKGSGKTLIKIGVSFDFEKRSIAEWKYGGNKIWDS